MILVYITAPCKKEAEGIATLLVKERLAACANYFPIESVFLWDDRLEKTQEYAIIAKTVRGKLDALRERVGEVHSYDIPCIIAIDAEANETYENWVNDQTSD